MDISGHPRSSCKLAQGTKNITKLLRTIVLLHLYVGTRNLFVGIKYAYCVDALGTANRLEAQQVAPDGYFLEFSKNSSEHFKLNMEAK